MKSSQETFSFKITVDEPNKKKDYDILKDVQIQVTFTYEIDEDTIITIDIDWKFKERQIVSLFW